MSTKVWANASEAMKSLEKSEELTTNSVEKVSDWSEAVHLVGIAVDLQANSMPENVGAVLRSAWERILRG